MYDFKERTNRRHPIGCILTKSAMPHSYVRHGAFLRVTWLAHASILPCSSEWHAPFLWATRILAYIAQFFHTWDMTPTPYSCVRYGSRICAMTHSYEQHAAFHVARFLHTPDMTHSAYSYVRYDSHVSDTPRSRKQHYNNNPHSTYTMPQFTRETWRTRHIHTRDTTHLHMRSTVFMWATHLLPRTEWLRLVGPLKLQVSFAKEPYKRDDILQKKPMIWRSLLLVATP